jgi:hypothetical protein
MAAALLTAGCAGRGRGERIVLVKRIATAARKGGTAVLQTLTSQAAALAGRAGTTAKAVGFKECGRTTSL